MSGGTPSPSSKTHELELMSGGTPSPSTLSRFLPHTRTHATNTHVALWDPATSPSAAQTPPPPYAMPSSCCASKRLLVTYECTALTLFVRYGCTQERCSVCVTRTIFVTVTTTWCMCRHHKGSLSVTTSVCATVQSGSCTTDMMKPKLCQKGAGIKRMIIRSSAPTRDTPLAVVVVDAYA